MLYLEYNITLFFDHNNRIQKAWLLHSVGTRNIYLYDSGDSENSQTEFKSEQDL